MTSGSLRVIDFGRVSPLHSQTLWHAIAHGVSAGEPATLSLMQPDAAYVSIGFHRDVEEVDQEHCRRTGLPVYRRMVGGGPVYLDDGQFFFQITVPIAAVPAGRAQAVRALLQPAVDAFRATGVAASLETDGDVVVGDRKICGHGAGQIEQAVVVVGNLITRFDHATATRIMATPDRGSRAELRALMERYVAETPVDPKAFSVAAVRAYGAALDLEPEVRDRLTGREEQVLAELDGTFVEDEWLRKPARRSVPVWRVKVKAGVFVAHAAEGRSRLRVSLASGRILRTRLIDPALNGRGSALQETLEGLTLAESKAMLAGTGLARLSALMERIERES